MTNFKDDLARLLDSVRILSPAAFTFRGEQVAVNPAPIQTTHPLPPDPLTRDLQGTLYARCYTQRLESPAPAAPEDVPGFAAALSAHNRTQASWENGWNIYHSAPDGHVYLQKGDRQKTAVPGEFISNGVPGVPPQIGGSVMLMVPRESAVAQPGFYFAYGQTLPDVWDEFSLLRFYFHSTAQSAPSVLEWITGEFNRHQVPFKMKTLVDPRHYTRTDATVLYLARRHHDIARTLIGSFPAAIQLRPEVPLFTLPVRDGVGMAEEPNTGESFGMHRCRMVAEAIVDLWKRGDQSTAGRLKAVEAQFRASGFDLERPYLNPGNAPLFAPPVILNGHGRRLDNRVAGQQAFLDAAARIGTRLCRDAIWSGDRVNWLGWAVQAGGASWSTVYRAQPAALYDGTAGIGLFLARLSAATGDSLSRATALAAVKSALAAVPNLPPDFAHAIYSGAAGVGWAAVEAGEALGDPALVERGLAVFERAIQQPPSAQWVDTIGGSAGLIPVALDLARRFGKPQWSERAAAHGRMLIESATRSDRGLSWDTLPGQTRAHLNGYGHGASGIGCALLELWNADGGPAFRAAALDAFRYERSYFSAEQHNWPDLRSMAAYGVPDSQPVYARAWCHGAPGIGLARLRALELLGSDAPLERDLEEALISTIESCSNVSFPASGNLSLCHGIGGNADLLIEAAARRGRNDLLSRAEEAGRQAIAQLLASDMPLPCGVNGGGESPNLMLGIAGIGHFFLRLYDAAAAPSVLLLRGAPAGAEKAVAA